MATDPIMDSLNLTTLKEIWPHVALDNYFKGTPFQAHIKDHCMVPFGGGAFSQATFLFKPLIGGAYAMGQSFNMTKRETLSGMVFDPKYYEVAVPEFKEIVQVLNVGPNAAFSLIEIDLKTAMQTICAIIAIDMSLHGQSGSGIIGNRTLNMNGWIEAANDGITPGWDGSVFTAYGTQVRNGVIGDTLNSIPLWCGDANGNPGLPSYPILEESYQDASRNNVEPNLGVSNKQAFASIKEVMQVQQRFSQEKDPYFGTMGFKFNGSTIVKDDYFPSKKYGKNDPDLGNYLTGTFSSPGTTANGGTAAANSNLPVSGTTVTVGEVFAWMQTAQDHCLFRLSTDPEYAFGFSGFLPAQDNTRVVGYVKAAVNLELPTPWAFKQLYGLK